ncbi:acetyl/propionyl/methylcrotonyl-CoA carboxylase subunit alpha [Treponema lecithinolyticum]|jgi:biotin carboxylase|uniref:biotin carboxylase n=1 Tax=Treponema lecithinolyticum ATCC 700332 TaxID=1321815 RepID=A0ABN0NW27_TRELE|nr:biotin carboxylase N-terminal domain-containing protein [Treponema lecithinolyticum]ERJ91565.1 putative acetyl-CoA carboxylase, biotin carboxylase subunit [Treponema lecithinolyticum ATCC 700332]
MIKKLLVANRGEIAVRIIRACREMGIKTVAVYSTADKNCLHVQLADKAVCIGPAPSAKSYLNRQALITAALCTGCEAVHPGVGFLSENAEFAREVEKAGLYWIGPKPDTIEMLGDKVKARATAQKSGLPVTPGSANAVKTPKQGAEEAKKCGYPIIIKAASGGGGKGMRIVWKEKDLAENLSIASAEALSNFADGTVYIEKYLCNPRHVELQVVGNGKGAVAVLGERDCSVQKNHQKLIEESPSPAVSDKMRQAMCSGAIRLFSSLKYRGAGTIEFLVSGDDFYFMEVNARIQVEHPVSEMITGTDIIREQICVCTGGTMSLPSGVLPTRGWAMEARINARTPGTVKTLRIPGGNGVRFDGFLYQGYTVVPFYDSMTAKLIVHSETREQTIQKLLSALDELCIEGIQTNKDEQIKILNSALFKSGNFGTGLYEELFTAGEK